MHAIYNPTPTFGRNDNEESEVVTECGDVIPNALMGQRPVVWNGYRLDRTIGRGEFAKVKLAYHLDTHTPVAIKFLLQPTHPKCKHSKSGEANLIRLLRHPNIVPVREVYDYHYEEEGTEGSEGEGMAIVMDYCRDGELFALVERMNGLEEERARKFFMQLISAVDYLHSVMRIVHRDIKLVTKLI